ncbi:MAG TPA: entericidin A/B family lipoprotein [Azospirillaceae bacterium]|nr:entericidin A/B family lipoprotein [Azospirillaceae bacterium]
MSTNQTWKKLLAAGLLLAATAVSACNTVAGAGEDLQAGGRAVERTANDVKS